MKCLASLGVLGVLMAGCASPTPRRLHLSNVSEAPPAPTSPAPNVAPLRSPSIVVFFDRESSAPQIEQRLLLRSGRRSLEERGIDVLFAWERVEDIDGRPVPSLRADELRRALKAPPLGFTVLYVDGGGKIRWAATKPMTPQTALALRETASRQGE